MSHSRPGYNHKPPSPNNFCHMVKEAITDEIDAVQMYAKMANMVDNMTLKTLILSIAGDEYGHAKTWIAIDTLLCGHHSQC
ncbi:Ferritin-related [Syntrophomonas zehnderi OL-4]|uniref:Ferritin-related n=1 Tax=Syntrophomonas zehnderi OL-4 TaxID=690567 RepID=A0A0E4GB50_9FIRM|nr:ferritin-like domain-containing protein [Syntrophomonas zehnderi]CFX56867.1 Ferritin-related [Syntrophomonas zehnderi OL-4]